MLIKDVCLGLIKMLIGGKDGSTLKEPQSAFYAYGDSKTKFLKKKE